MTESGAVDVAGAVPPAAILIVDDTPSKRLALRAMLAPLGLTLIEADSGRAALSAVRHEAFALILMDVRMPIMDGYETARLVREHRPTALTPIIFVTASIEEHPTATDSAYASGAIDFIFTPIHPDVLRAKVSLFADLFVQSRELQRSLESVTALHAALRDSEVRAGAVLQNVADGIVTARRRGSDRIAEPIGATAVRLQRGGGDRAAPAAHRRSEPSRRAAPIPSEPGGPRRRSRSFGRDRPRPWVTARTARPFRWRWT